VPPLRPRAVRLQPALNGSLYLFPKFAYRSLSGDLVVVIDVISGQRNLDILWDEATDALKAYAISPAGNEVQAVAWWTEPDVAVSSSLGLRIPKGRRTMLVLFFPEFQGSHGVATTVTVHLDWGGSDVLELDLPELPRP